MRIPPKSVQQSWPPPNYEHPETRGQALLIINVVLVALATIALAGRLYSRICIKFHIGVDDVLIIPAFTFDIGMTVVVLLANYDYDANRHIWDIPPHNLENANIMAFITKLMYSGAVTFIRLSLIYFYYRLFRDSSTKPFRWALHVSLAWTLAVFVMLACLSIWLCSPVRAYWVVPPMVPRHGHCMDEGTVMLIGGTFSTITDFLITVLPTPVIMRLQMPLKQRLQICVLLCLGMTATIAGAVRVYYTYKSLIASWDETWWTYYLYIAGSVETHLGMICSCAPAWKPLLQHPLKQLSSRLSARRLSDNSPIPPSTTKMSRFQPLQSLRFFQHTRLGFERTQDGAEECSCRRFEKFNPSLSTVAEAARGSESRGVEASEDTRHLGGITVQHSIDQSSIHIGENQAPPRLTGRMVAVGWS